uniref:Attractin-like 1a n=1 Tax=Neogobius melanostomus TaxID=47308 RepID=A0A8C6T4C4_9GOBI
MGGVWSTYLEMLLVVVVMTMFPGVQGSAVTLTCPESCYSGSCVNGSCVCDHGWVGDRCQHCQGRFKITERSGSLTDGPVNYKYKTKCTWLIEGQPNSVLRLRFSHFATECSWDHMYVYDGDSIFSPLIAVFSGLMVPENIGNNSAPEVATTSGYSLLHFFSDAAYNLTGFNIIYSINSCPQNCSGHGRCVGVNPGTVSSSRVYCECEEFWKGEACQIPYCSNHCGSPDHGHCDLTGGKRCVCNDSRQGPDCSLPVPSADAFWELPGVTHSALSLGRASHQAVVHRGLMWVVGGYSFNYSDYYIQPKEKAPIMVMCTLVLSVPCCSQDDVYMFGGSWRSVLLTLQMSCGASTSPGVCGLRSGQSRGPLPPGGTQRHVVPREDGQHVMLVFFGYSPVYSYLSEVQEYLIGQSSWQVLTTRGALVQGGYGHSSVYDEASGYVFLHGGYKTLGSNKYGLVDHMYRYHVHTRTWWILKESGLARHLHSMALLSGTLLVFGGNTHNDTSLSSGAKCFSSDFLAYDIACDEWTVLPKPALLQDVQRYGHSAVVSNGRMYIFGGFSGACVIWHPPLHDLSSPATFYEQCFPLADCGSCTSSTHGCQWCEEHRCISAHSNCSVVSVTAPGSSSTHAIKYMFSQACEEGWDHVGEVCLQINSSKDSYDNAQHFCKNQGGNMASLLTATHVSYILDQLSKLQLHSKLSPWVGLRKINVSYWGWEDMSSFTNSSLRWLPGEPNDSGFCAYMDRAEVSSLTANPCTANTDGFICEKPRPAARPCRLPCSHRTSCRNCTSQSMECMWCGSTQRCVETAAYVVSFPYGQCLEWQTQDCQAETCLGLHSCSECLERVECGWCGDPSNTGTGVCMEGSARGPMKPLPSSSQQSLGPQTLRGRDMGLDHSLCAADRGFSWAFIQCPACQCNGHSQCVDRSVCERCENFTSGPRCESCMPGYYGDPTNGGTCHACNCNNHANVCHANTGKCHCTTKGIRGDQCHLCDSENRYQGNPLRGTCYYNLLMDYQFTFSLLQDDDRYYTTINFMATPEQNLDMSINASNNFNLNISWSLSSTARTISGEELSLISRTNIREHRDSFSCDSFNFRLHHNITFYVYLSNFSWPIRIQIAFSQHNSVMDLVQFFVTFFRSVRLYVELLNDESILTLSYTDCFNRHLQCPKIFFFLPKFPSTCYHLFSGCETS